MFRIIQTGLPGLVILQPRTFLDLRGSFVKTFHAGIFQQLGIEFHPVEEFYSVSRENVVRGMHFQLPPAAHQKLIYCVAGRVLDVVVDLRKASPTFGQASGRELSSENREICFIPVGFAHGFLSLADNTMLIYLADTVHAPQWDAGIHWRSFGFDWPVVDSVLSERDLRLPKLAEFNSPF
jgi:dTDP-4-dehydrorhamnose 3,5-epimerase